MRKIIFDPDNLISDWWHNPIYKYFLDKGCINTCDARLFYDHETDEVIYEAPKRTVIVQCWYLRVWYDRTFRDKK